VQARRILLPVLCLGVVACSAQDDAYETNKQQIKAQQDFDQAVVHLDRAKSRVRHQPVAETEGIIKLKEQYLQDKGEEPNPALEKIKALLTIEDREGTYETYRHKQLQAAKPHLEELAKDDKGRAIQRLQAHIAVAEIHRATARQAVREATHAADLLSPLYAGMASDASTIRLLLASSMQHQKVDFDKHLSNLQSQQQELQGEADAQAQKVEALSQKVQKLTSEIQNNNQQRVAKFGEAQALAQKALSMKGTERFKTEKQSIDLFDESAKLQIQIDRAEADRGVTQAQLTIAEAQLANLKGQLEQLGEAVADLQKRRNSVNKLSSDALAEVERLMAQFDESLKAAGTTIDEKVNGVYAQAEADYNKAIEHLTQANQLASTAQQYIDELTTLDPEDKPHFADNTLLQLSVTRSELGHALHRQAISNLAHEHLTGELAESLKSAGSDKVATLVTTLETRAPAAKDTADGAIEKATKLLTQASTDLTSLKGKKDIRTAVIRDLIPVYKGLALLTDNEDHRQKADALRGELNQE